jgi:hypothetical protein
LTCEKAVEAAAALPSSHPLIIAFHHGFYCPPGLFCAFSGPPNGYVVFDTQGTPTDIHAQVRADEAGNVSITSGPAPFPPIGGMVN